MKQCLALVPALLCAGLLAGCVDEMGPHSGAVTPAPAAQMRSGSPADEKACLTAVARKTQNSVHIISSDFSQANTMVMVGVGPQSAPWKCLVSRGRVAEVMSMTHEGTL